MVGYLWKGSDWRMNEGEFKKRIKQQQEEFHSFLNIRFSQWIGEAIREFPSLGVGRLNEIESIENYSDSPREASMILLEKLKEIQTWFFKWFGDK